MANTHLFYHPLAGYIRLLQMQCLINRIEELVSGIKANPVRENKLSSWASTGDADIDELYLLKEQSVQNCLKGLEGKSQATAIDAMKSPDTTMIKDIGVILMGDLNSCPGTALHEYIHGAVSPEALANAWQDLTKFRWRAKEDVIDEVSSAMSTLDVDDVATQEFDYCGPLPPSFFTHSLNLVNTDKNGEIRYTNFTADYKNVLDYIFISERTIFDTRTISMLDMPTLDELCEETALPSSKFPSDHISIVADIYLL